MYPFTIKMVFVLGRMFYMIKFRNVLTDEKDLNEVFKTLMLSDRWGFCGSSSKKSPKKFWYMELINNNFFNTYFFDKIKNLLSSDFEIEKLYANGQTFGLDSEWHTDSIEENRYTFLYYANKTWNPTWGGETLFCDENRNLEYVYPEPNSAIYFPSNIFHYGRAPSRECPVLRTTVAYKLKLI